MKNEVLAIVVASPPRRVIGVGSVLILGVTAICVALLRPPSNPGWVVFLLVLGLGALWLTDRMRKATSNRLELTRDALRSSTGEVLVNVADVEAIERGAFAFKPSNGFTLRLKPDAQSGPKRWEPGLWWRLGNRVGVGGVTPGHQGRAMAEILSAVMQEPR